MSTESLLGKVALVTGASSGIGRATALKLAKAGARVVVASRRKELNESLIQEIESFGGSGLALTVDVSREADIERLLSETIRRFGRLDIAFNNAGVEEVPGPLEGKTEEAFDFVFGINVKGVLLSMKHEIAAMLKTGGGTIINTTSVAGHLGMAGVPIYVASKHAVEGLTKSLALEYAKQGIRINSVAPAAIETPMLERFVDGLNAPREALQQMHPVGRMGRPEEIADAVLFLASASSSFITGHSLLVDGGFTAQ